VRVVAGEFRGRRLSAPRGREIRPTSDRVREALFQILGPLDGIMVLDLFAGCGALGVEALSRGAARVVFVDSAEAAIAAVRGNIPAEASGRAEVLRRDAAAFLRGWRGEAFGLALLDPPYSSAPRLSGPLSEALPGVLSDDARIVTESAKRAPLHLSLPLADERFYGTTRIAIHHVR